MAHCSPLPVSVAPFDASKRCTLLALHRVSCASELTPDQQMFIFTHFAPREKPGDPFITLAFWDYVLFCPEECLRYADEMVRLVHCFMRRGDPAVCQCGCAVDRIDRDAFLDAAREAMLRAVEANRPDVFRLQMGDPCSIGWGPPVTPFRP